MSEADGTATTAGRAGENTAATAGRAGQNTTTTAGRAGQNTATAGRVGEPPRASRIETTGHAPDVDPSEIAWVERQLGRLPRGIVSIVARCPCGCPTVVRTRPRLPDGTPFPTSFYATCPRLTAAISTLESQGMMRDMTERLAADEALAAAYRGAHEDYLRRRAELGEVPEIAGVSAGGMPHRVKCLHVLVAHSLAAGPGVNPLGDEALAALPSWWSDGCCQQVER